MTDEPKEPAAKKTGRPCGFTQEIADKICDLLSDGHSLRRVCSMESMPEKITVLRWLRSNDAFCTQYARAKQEAADTYADDMTDIADDGSNDWTERLDKDGNPTGGLVPNIDHINRSRLRVDTRKWIAAKLKPKKYGEKVEHEHSGKIGLEQLVNGSVAGPDTPSK